MDWIEQWFGFAPDNGNGSVELMVMVAAAVILAAGLAWYLPGSRTAIVQFFARLGLTRRL